MGLQSRTQLSNFHFHFHFMILWKTQTKLLANPTQYMTNRIVSKYLKQKLTRCASSMHAKNMHQLAKTWRAVQVRCMKHGTQSQGFRTTQRDGMGREAGRGSEYGDTCTPVADPCQCMAKKKNHNIVTSLPLNKYIFLKNMTMTKRNRWIHYYSWRLQHPSIQNGQTRQAKISKDIVELNSIIN